MAHRLMLVDDHPVVRRGLASFLQLQPDLRVLAEAGTLAQAQTLCQQMQFDLVLLDLRLPDGSGLNLIPALRALPQPPRVLVLTSFLEEQEVREALRRGASGFLLKHAGTDALLDGVRAALRGEVPLDSAAVRALAEPERDPLAMLTPRERQVLQLLTEGLSNQEIARRLGIKEKTVKTHAGNLFAKLGVRHRMQALLWAKDRGL